MKKILILVVVLIVIAVVVTKFRGNGADVSEFANEAAVGNIASAQLEDGEYRVQVESLTENPEDTMLTLTRVSYEEGSAPQPRNDGQFRAPVSADTEFRLLDNDDATLQDFVTHVLGATQKRVYQIEVEDGRIQDVEELR